MIPSTKIGLGTVQFGMPYGISNKSGKTKPEEVAHILEFAQKKSIFLLDSASGYGEAEEVLGKNNLTEFKIVSKYLPPSQEKSIMGQFNQSLHNLKVKKLYGYLAHRPLVLLDEPEQWEILKRLKKEGLVEKIGFSLNEPIELEKLLKKKFTPDLVQVPYNYFDRRFENTMKDLKNAGCEIHTRSTFLQGLFFIEPSELSNYFNEIKPLLNNLQEDKQSLAGKLLDFVLGKKFVDKVIIGVENAAQLKANLEFKTAEALPELNFTISDNILIPSKWPKN